jgi:hypothetical protein
MTVNVCKVRVTIESYTNSDFAISQLFLNDPSMTPVATFHRKHRGIFSDKRPASLEVFPPGEHMVDLILITFIYMEKLRKDSENSRKSHGGGGS